MRFQLEGASIFDPTGALGLPPAEEGELARGSLRVENGRLAAASAQLPPGSCPVFDTAGLVLAPGLVDIHVHFRDPGEEEKEDLISGGRAAVAGGFTHVVTMANTRPPIDEVPRLRDLARRALASPVHIYPAAAVTRGLEGESLTEMVRLAEAGAWAFSDDGRPLPNARMARLAMRYSTLAGRPLLLHAEDPSLSAGGVLRQGLVSTRLGLRGIPATAEEVAIAREIALARETGARIHIQHLSTARAVDLVRQAREEGLAVTAEVTPHHLALTDEAVARWGSVAKMNPPLGSAFDREALRRGLAEGVIDCIATDHAPHTREEKDRELDLAPFGVVGLETAVGVVLTEAVHSGLLSLRRALHLLTLGPASILGLPAGRLEIGRPADLVLIDPWERWTVDPDRFASKGRHTPFAGATLTGRAVATWVDGKLRAVRGQPVNDEKEGWRLLEAYLSERTSAAPEAAERGAPGLGQRGRPEGVWMPA